MNPFRDRLPERASERYLTALRDGRVEVLTEILSGDVQDRFMESERKWPVQSWRIGRRQDTAGTSELMYWVKRGNGYSEPGGHEEEVYFGVVRSREGVRVVDFGAIY
ncbi:MAG TPA: hypothetical protein VF618_17810 [Thermoanaerobaculia bacterium]